MPVPDADSSAIRLQPGQAFVSMRRSPRELWEQAGGDRARYLDLMREHGHLIPGKREPGTDIFGHSAAQSREPATPLQWLEERVLEIPTWEIDAARNPAAHVFIPQGDVLALIDAARHLPAAALADLERVRALEEDFTRRVRNTWGGERAEQAIRMLQWSITAASSPPSEPAE